MLRTFRPFFITLAFTWLAISGAALYLSNQHHFTWMMSAALPAFLIEAIFYLGAVFAETRTLFARVSGNWTKGALLWTSAIVPYFEFSVSAGTFQRNAFYLLAGLCAVLAFWYAALPRRAAYDLGFLIIAAAPILLRVFQRIYQSPDPHFRIDILGHLMWVRLGIAALLALRGWDPGGFGFWPRPREWRIGFAYYLAVVLPIIALALVLDDVHFSPLHGEWWRIGAIAIGTFFGVLWVVALGEELFFRGVVARALLDNWRSPVIAVLLSATLFGAVHLWFHTFPDWRRALVATLLGIACGIAYVRSGSVRAPMVTHAFVVATWRVFFK